jgi:hypothetical protein
MMERGTLHKTFEYYDHAQQDQCVELRIHFTFRHGCKAQIFGPAEGCYPAESAEWDFASAEREAAPGKWEHLAKGEWLESWCRAALENAEECDLIEALPDRGDD